MLPDIRKPIQEYRQRLDFSAFGVSMKGFHGSKHVSITKKLMNVFCILNTIFGGILSLSRMNGEKRTIYRNFEKSILQDKLKRRLRYKLLANLVIFQRILYLFLCSRRNHEVYIIGAEHKTLEYTDMKNNRGVRVTDRNGALAALKRIIQHISLICLLIFILSPFKSKSP